MLHHELLNAGLVLALRKAGDCFRAGESSPDESTTNTIKVSWTTNVSCAEALAAMDKAIEVSMKVVTQISKLLSML